MGKNSSKRSGSRPGTRAKTGSRVSPTPHKTPKRRSSAPPIKLASGQHAPRPARAGAPQSATEAKKPFALKRAARLKAERERSSRIAAYDKWLSSKPKRARPGLAMAAPAKPKPRILAEGDSWFDYPWFVDLDGGIIPHLADLADIEILNLAHYGDEVRSMLALEQRRRLEKMLSDDKRDFQALLFSGGGNDIVGDQFCLWLRPFSPGMTPADALDPARLAAIMFVVEIGYREIIDLRDRLRPSCHILTHAYDFPRATGVPVCSVGPWLKPSLVYRGWTNASDQFEIVKRMMLGFDSMLTRLEAEQRGLGRPFTYVRTQGTIDPATDWANEIHPDSQGFAKLAKVFNNALADVFPASFTKLP